MNVREYLYEVYSLRGKYHDLILGLVGVFPSSFNKLSNAFWGVVGGDVLLYLKYLTLLTLY